MISGLDDEQADKTLIKLKLRSRKVAKVNLVDIDFIANNLSDSH